MRDTDDLVELIKSIFKNTQEAMQPTNMIYGEVKSISPLQIEIDQKIILTNLQLILSRNVTEWIEDIEIDWTETTHHHDFNGDGSVVDGDTNLKGVYQIKHKTALKVGEKVILIMLAGGQQYLVLDRV